MSKRLNMIVSIFILCVQVNAGKISGPIELNGETYHAECTCQADSDSEIANVKCHPNTVHISCDLNCETEDGAGIEEINEKFGDAQGFTYVQINYEPFMCLDGRVTKKHLFTPGGDLGELLLGLLAYEDIIEEPVNLAEVKDIFTKYLRCMVPEKFYHCTDDEAISHLEKELNSQVDIENPNPQSLEGEILEAITSPNNNGDLHFKSLLLAPDEYNISHESHVLDYVLQTFYAFIWDENFEFHDKLKLEIFPGVHNETAFIEIKNEHQCMIEQTAPIFEAREGDKHHPSYFINHLDAVNVRRTQIAQFFADKISRNQNRVTPERMFTEMVRYGNHFLDKTGQYVASLLPFYTVNLENE